MNHRAVRNAVGNGRRSCGGERGFSILEATVVLAMMAIVAATASGHIKEFLDTARNIKAQGDVRTLVTSITQFLNDVGRLRGPNGGAAPSLLVSAGDIPEVATAEGAEWTRPLDARHVQDLYAHLVENSVGYPMDAGEGNRWRGPYVEGLKTDPWGFRYAVNIGCLTAAGPGYMTIAVSAGPDGVITAPFRARVVVRRETDDVVGMVSTGKDRGPVPEKASPREGAQSNLCEGTDQ